MATEIAYRSSFERFCDNYAIDLLKCLSFVDRIKLLRVSKQFLCLPMKQTKMLCWTRTVSYEDIRKLNLKKFGQIVFNIEEFNNILKKLKFLNHFEFKACELFDRYTEHQVLIKTIELCNKVKHFCCEFN